MQLKSDTPNFDFWMLMNDPEHEAHKKEAAQVIARLDEAIGPDVSISPLELMLLAQIGDMHNDAMRLNAIRAQHHIQRHKAINCGRALLVWLAASAMFAVSVWLMFRGGN